MVSFQSPIKSFGSTHRWILPLLFFTTTIAEIQSVGSSTGAKMSKTTSQSSSFFSGSSGHCGLCALVISLGEWSSLVEGASGPQVFLPLERHLHAGQPLWLGLSTSCWAYFGQLFIFLATLAFSLTRNFFRSERLCYLY